jgi:polyisoprenoid-binding protein YceI
LTEREAGTESSYSHLSNRLFLKLTSKSAECLVFAFKEGLLSPIAHDLKIRVGGFEIEVDEEARTVQATFDSNSLEVVAARKNGRDNQKLLSRRDRTKIAANIRKSVLKSSRYPQIRYVSNSSIDSADGLTLEGILTLNGKSRPISVSVTQRDKGRVATARIHQPDFGINPYTALLGTLRVKPAVLIEVRYPV